MPSIPAEPAPTTPPKPKPRATPTRPPPPPYVNKSPPFKKRSLRSTSAVPDEIKPAVRLSRPSVSHENILSDRESGTTSKISTKVTIGPSLNDLADSIKDLKLSRKQWMELFKDEQMMQNVSTSKKVLVLTIKVD